MQSFVQRYQEGVIGVLGGFDRVLFRGTLRSISYAEGALATSLCLRPAAG